MFRLTTLFALLVMLFTACNPPVESNTVVATPTTDTPDVHADPTPVTDVSGDFGGEMVILDDKIKSHRKELTGEIDGVAVIINYGSPAVNDRVIYGDLVPFGKVWRTGANEATRVTFKGDVIVGADSKHLKAGTYSLFTLPASKDEWTVIFNTEPEQWGAYDYDDSKDAVRAAAIAEPNADQAERMDFYLVDDAIQLKWDDLVVKFPVSAASK